MDLSSIANTDLIAVFFEKSMLTAVTKKQLESYSQTWGVSGFQALIDCAIYEEDDLISFCAEYFSMSRVFDLLDEDVDVSVLKKFDIRSLMEHFFMPYDFVEESQTLKVVISSPTVVQEVAKTLAQKYGNETVHFEFSIATVQQIINFLGRFYANPDSSRSADVFKENATAQTWKP